MGSRRTLTINIPACAGKSSDWKFHHGGAREGASEFWAADGPRGVLSIPLALPAGARVLSWKILGDVVVEGSLHRALGHGGQHFRLDVEGGGGARVFGAAV